LHYNFFFNRAGWDSDKTDGERSWLLDAHQMIDGAVGEVRDNAIRQRDAAARAAQRGQEQTQRRRR
jgi:hypothetical protein